MGFTEAALDTVLKTGPIGALLIVSLIANFRLFNLYRDEVAARLADYKSVTTVLQAITEANRTASEAQAARNSSSENMARLGERQAQLIEGLIDASREITRRIEGIDRNIERVADGRHLRS